MFDKTSYLTNFRSIFYLNSIKIHYLASSFCFNLAGEDPQHSGLAPPYNFMTLAHAVLYEWFKQLSQIKDSKSITEIFL